MDEQALILTIEEASPTPEEATQHGRALARVGASKGGRARASVLSPDERSAIARQAAATRWGKKEDGQASKSLEQTKSGDLQPAELPERNSAPAEGTYPIALFPGSLAFGEGQYSVYVLNNGKRVMAQRELVKALTGQNQGNLNRFLEAPNLQPFSPDKVNATPVEIFSIPGTQFLGHGYEATHILDICDIFLRAREAGELKGVQQKNIARQAEIITRVCAKIGIIALIDEATGYDKFKKKQEYQIKLQAFIADELQEWARMFPEEFWFELARLEGIRYSPRNRPLRWGKYVMMFVYDAVDGDVGKELRKKNPDPHFLKNHHQWLKKFGRDKVEMQIAKVVTIMKLCNDMTDFKDKFSRVFKKTPLQMSFDDLGWM